MSRAPSPPSPSVSQSWPTRLRYEVASYLGVATGNWDKVEHYQDRIDGQSVEAGFRRMQKGKLGRWLVFGASTALFITLLVSPAAIPFGAILALYGVLIAANLVFTSWTMRGNHSGVAKLERSHRERTEEIFSLRRDLSHAGIATAGKGKDFAPLSLGMRLKYRLFGKTPPLYQLTLSPSDIGKESLSGSVRRRNAWEARHRHVVAWRRTTLVTGVIGAFITALSVLVPGLDFAARVTFGTLGRALSFFNLSSLDTLSAKRRAVSEEKLILLERDRTSLLERARAIHPDKPHEIQQRWLMVESVLKELQMLKQHSSSFRFQQTLLQAFEHSARIHNRVTPLPAEHARAIVRDIVSTIQKADILTREKGSSAFDPYVRLHKPALRDLGEHTKQDLHPLLKSNDPLDRAYAALFHVAEESYRTHVPTDIDSGHAIASEFPRFIARNQNQPSHSWRDRVRNGSTSPHNYSAAR